MNKYLSSNSALLEIGSRLKMYRIYSSLTQEDLSMKSGVSRRSIQNMENGEDVNFSTIIKVLMALGLDPNLDLLIPDSSRRPSYYLKANADTKRRSRVIKNKVQDLSKEFKWGDEK